MVFFADRMYQLRNEKGYTREQLASELGCMPRQIQDYEEGKLYPHAITMVDIADFFDVSLDYLMGRTESREINKIK
ncbi:MAG: helix-turn-helix transcriptional regulator [Negativibacillus sp.]|nr:helix-turn-helix transcriptional regulator [Negativibacillus sp.]